MQEKPIEKKSKFVNKTLHSRNFLHFAVASTIATAIYLYCLSKCYLGEVFDHVAADRYSNTWANNICIFAAIFLLGETSKAGVKIIQAKYSGQPPSSE